MRTALSKAIPLVLLATTVIVGGCASSSDVDELRSEMSGIRADMQKMNEEIRRSQEMSAQAANNAAASAQEARTSTAAAHQKAGRFESGGAGSCAGT